MTRLLLADIGGTYASFAVAHDDEVGPTVTVELAAYRTAVEAIREVLARDGEGKPLDAPLDGALLSATGTVQGGRCEIANGAWILDEEEIARGCGLPWVRLVNDLEAVAAGLVHLPRSQTRTIGREGGPDTGLPGAPQILLSPGTGLGMACLVSAPAGLSVVTSEGGHASLAGIDAETDKIIAVLRRHHPHVSAELVLSGEGLVRLYQAIALLDGTAVVRLLPAEVTARAFDGSCKWSAAAVDTFCALLGAVAGDVALTFGAQGGVFIGGGIVPRFIDHLARSRFRQQFEAKGRLQPYLARIPTRVIVHPAPAVFGLMNMANERIKPSRRPAAR
jgi:glucokinase